MVEVGRKAAEPNEVGMEKYGMPTVMARTNDHCLYKVEYGVVNTVQFKKKEGQLICSLCQKQPSYIPCKARRYLVIKESHVRVFHYGNHTCAFKRPPHSSAKEDMKGYLRKNLTAKPSHVPSAYILSMVSKCLPPFASTTVKT